MNSKLKMVQENPWYQEGLSFECTGCSKCCEGSPGYVWVTPEEITKIAKYLEISEEMFHQKYLIKVKDRFSIKDLPKANYRCIFLKDKQCTIYPVRPSQCKTYPFWPDILKDKGSWEHEKRACEGISCKSQKVGVDEILEKLSASSSQ